MNLSLGAKILIAMGLAKATYNPEAKFVSKTDPLTAPRRKPTEVSGLTYSKKFTIAWFGTGITVVSLLVFAMHADTITGKELVPDEFGSEKEMRAFWGEEIKKMSCNQLKQIIDVNDDRGEYSKSESIKYIFARGEYSNLGPAFPSTRGNECVNELGYAKHAIEYCENWTRSGCIEYEFPRSDDGPWWEFDPPPNLTMTFPNDWFYVDPYNGKTFEDPNEFLETYFPEMLRYESVMGQQYEGELTVGG